MITHEIEVKVTEHFTQIDDQTDELGRETSARQCESNRSAEHHKACAPWDERSETVSGCGGAGLKLGSETVMMRDLGRKTTESSLEAGISDLPYDGSTSPVPLSPRSPSRAFFANRESKEGLLQLR